MDNDHPDDMSTREGNIIYYQLSLDDNCDNSPAISPHFKGENNSDDSANSAESNGIKDNCPQTAVDVV